MNFDFVKLLTSFGVKAMAGLAGWQAWIIDLVLNKLLKLFNKWWNNLLIAIKVKKEVQDELKKYEGVVDDKKSTADDVKKSAPDFLG